MTRLHGLSLGAVYPLEWCNYTWQRLHRNSEPFSPLISRSGDSAYDSRVLLSKHSPPFRNVCAVNTPLGRRKGKGLGCERTRGWKSISGISFGKKTRASAPRALSSFLVCLKPLPLEPSITTLHRIQIFPLHCVNFGFCQSTIPSSHHLCHLLTPSTFTLLTKGPAVSLTVCPSTQVTVFPGLSGQLLLPFSIAISWTSQLLTFTSFPHWCMYFHGILIFHEKFDIVFTQDSFTSEICNASNPSHDLLIPSLFNSVTPLYLFFSFNKSFYPEPIPF